MRWPENWDIIYRAYALGLIALNASDRFVPGLRGLSLKNVEVRITQEDGKEVYQGFGEMLFTHFGVSGPLDPAARPPVSFRNICWKKKEKKLERSGFPVAHRSKTGAGPG